jgi:hypothetical protein
MDSQGCVGWAYGGDFGESIHGGNHCISGLAWPDRGFTTTRSLYADFSSDGSTSASSMFSTSTATTTSVSGSVAITDSVTAEQLSAALDCKLDPAEPISLATQVTRYGGPSKYHAKRSAKHMQKHLYGLSAHSFDSSEANSASGATSLNSPYCEGTRRQDRQANPSGYEIRHLFNLDAALVKPALLEAKQCMRNFECTLIGLKMLRRVGVRLKRSVSRGSSSNLDIEALAQQQNVSPWRRRPTMINTDMNKPLVLRVMMKPAPKGANGSPMHHLRENSDELSDSKLLSESATYQPYFRFSITNNFDHIDDIETELAFHAVLLCRGMIVASAAMDTVASGYVHKHHHGTGRNNNQGDHDSNRHSIQELDCEVHFAFETFDIDKNWLRMDLPIYRSRAFSTVAAKSPALYNANAKLNWLAQANDDNKSIIFGTEWPERLLLDTTTLGKLNGELGLPNNSTLQLHDDGKTSSAGDLNSVFVSESNTSSSASGNSQQRWAAMPESSSKGNWSIVIIGVTANHTTYACKGYPMAFQQLDVTKHMHNGINHLIAKDFDLKSQQSQHNPSSQQSSVGNLTDAVGSSIPNQATVVSTTVAIPAPTKKNKHGHKVHMMDPEDRNDSSRSQSQRSGEAGHGATEAQRTDSIPSSLNTIVSSKAGEISEPTDGASAASPGEPFQALDSDEPAFHTMSDELSDRSSIYSVPSLDLQMVDNEDAAVSSVSTVSDSPRYIPSRSSSFSRSKSLDMRGGRDDDDEDEEAVKEPPVTVQWCNLNSLSASFGANADNASGTGNPSHNFSNNNIAAPDSDINGYVNVTPSNFQANSTDSEDSPMFYSANDAAVVDGIKLQCKSVRNGGTSNEDVTVAINTASGMLDKIIVNNVNLLADRTLTLPEYLPSRIQLHRAATENDKAGFANRWSLIGLDKALQYVPNKNAIEQTSQENKLKPVPTNGASVVQECELPFTTVSPVTGSGYGLDNTYQGVSVHWVMYPSHINK